MRRSLFIGTIAIALIALFFAVLAEHYPHLKFAFGALSGALIMRFLDKEFPS